MIVDDNPANLKLLEDMLRQHGYEVRSFPRGRLALAAAEQEPPDLILLDINMPEMNGYEVCEQLKSSARLAGIPVIFLSALNAIEDKVKGFRSGGVDYISKPFQFEEVQARVETHLKLRRAQQAEHDCWKRRWAARSELCGSWSSSLRRRWHCDPARFAISCCWITKRMEIRGSLAVRTCRHACACGLYGAARRSLRKGLLRPALSPDEDRMFRAHPESAARLLSTFRGWKWCRDHSRTTDRRRWIRQQDRHGANTPFGAGVGPENLPGSDCSRRAGWSSGCRADSTAACWMRSKATLPRERNSKCGGSRFEDLRAGMVLENDVLSKDGNLLILKAGTILTETWIERLENFARSQRRRNW